MDIQKIPIGSINPAKYNPRIDLQPTDAEYIKLKNSIQSFGYVEPIIVNKNNNVIIGGHQRYKVLVDLGYTDVDVVYVDLDDTKEKALNIALNKINGDWDADKLEDLLRDIKLDDAFDIELTGFNLEEIDTIFSGAIDELDDEDNNEDDDVTDDDVTDDDEDDVPEEENIDINGIKLNIKRKNKHYGIVYQGNKTRIADIIINILPSGTRLVDLFGGGGAITHCALLYEKWNKILYNDINPLITTLFKDAINGKYKNESRVIDRETFKKLKDTDPYVKYLWSYCSNGDTYLYAEEKETFFNNINSMILNDNYEQRYKYFLKLIKDPIKYNCDKGCIVARLITLNELVDLKKYIDKIEFSNINYEQYTYVDGDVVYCDIPYEPKYNKNYYKSNFDNNKFYKWVKEQPFPVFFSSYEISDDSFNKILLKKVQNTISTSNNGFNNEYLYSNRPFNLDKLGV